VLSDERMVTAGSEEIGVKPLILLRINCRSILNRILEFWNLVDTRNSYVIVGME
jgi:hypothetical protein